MARTAGSTAENQRQRVSQAINLLQLGFKRREVIEKLIGDHGISESTAKRDCSQASETYRAELAGFDAPMEMQRIFDHQRLQAALALQAGESELALKWSNAARSTLSQLMRLDPMSSPAAWGRSVTVAVAEPFTPPTEQQRRKHRRSISELPDDIGF